MADLTITISNQLNLFGGGQPTLWGNTGVTTMTWGTDKWGSESEDLIEAIEKALANTLNFAAAYAEIQALHLVENSLSFASDITSAVLTNGDWSYVWPGDTTNADQRISTTYARPSDPSSTWAEPSHPSTVWS